MVANDQSNALGMGTWRGNFSTKSYTGLADISGGMSGTVNVSVSVNGGRAINVQV